MLRRRALARPGQDWLHFLRGERFTHGAFQDRVEQLGAGLLAAGVQPGDRVALLLENRPECLLAFFASLAIGAIAVPLNTGARGEVLRHYLALTEPAVLVAEGDLAGVLAAVLPRLARSPALYFVGPAEGELAAAARSFEELSLPTASLPERACLPGDPAAIIFTSGTTGPSKGVLFSHRYLANFAGLGVQTFGYTADDVAYTCLPFFHANALVLVTCASLLAGCRVAVARRFSLSGFWGDLVACEATVTSILGSMATLLLQQAPAPVERQHRVSRAMLVPAPAPLHRLLHERFGIVPIEMYGMTDAGIFLSNRWGHPLRPGSCGRVMDGYECRVADEEDEELPAGAVGQLLVRPTRPGLVSDGYWNMPERTVEAWRGLWFHTGDLVRRDEEGWFWFVDRHKDCIRRRGENISSHEVEQAFQAHPAVLEAAAYPLPSTLTEDDVALAVVLKPGACIEAVDLLRFAQGSLARHCLPRYVRFVDELPKTLTQKVQKQQLREQGVPPGTWDMEQAGLRAGR